MRTGDDTIFPVRTLEETATALEAAVLECLAKPRKKAVHKLRTTSRRIEAQLNLLGLVGGFPPYEEEAARLGKTLKKLRQAAGAVRDLDVQQDLVRDEMQSVSTDSGKEGRKLRRSLRHRRDAEADKLEDLLAGVRRKLPRRIGDLLHALQGVDEKGIEESRLATVVREWYRRQAEPFAASEEDDPERLHAIRKVAKLARYLAETAPKEAKRSHAVAGEFEAIQEAGGRWHDWMILAEVAAGELGDSAALPQRFMVHAAEALEDFKQKLSLKP